MVIDESHVSKEQIDRVDAQSRAFLQFVEDAGSPDVARYGDISYDAQNRRAISSTGNLAVTATDMGVETLEMCETVQISNGLICNARFRNERTGEVLKMPILKHIEPCDALATMRSDCDGYDTSHYDYRPMVQKLGLLDKDYDKLSSAPIVRVADDLLIPNAGFIIPVEVRGKTTILMFEFQYFPLFPSQKRIASYNVFRRCRPFCKHS